MEKTLQRLTTNIAVKKPHTDTMVFHIMFKSILLALLTINYTIPYTRHIKHIQTRLAPEAFYTNPKDF